MYSPSIDRLIRELKKLPSVGVHTAERFVFHWLSAGKKEVADMQTALKGLMDTVKSCEVCWNFSDSSPCAICQNPRRDQSTICVVANPQDIPAFEQTKAFSGVYHVLRGTIDASEQLGMESNLKLREFFARIKKNLPQEIILALNPDLPGETTMLFIAQKIRETNPELRITRLARGLPMGSSVQYADEITLASAFTNRSKQ